MNYIEILDTEVCCERENPKGKIIFLVLTKFIEKFRIVLSVFFSVFKKLIGKFRNRKKNPKREILNGLLASTKRVAQNFSVRNNLQPVRLGTETIIYDGGLLLLTDLM